MASVTVPMGLAVAASGLHVYSCCREICRVCRYSKDRVGSVTRDRDPTPTQACVLRIAGVRGPGRHLAGASRGHRERTTDPVGLCNGAYRARPGEGRRDPGSAQTPQTDPRAGTPTVDLSLPTPDATPSDDEGVREANRGILGGEFGRVSDVRPPEPRASSGLSIEHIDVLAEGISSYPGDMT